MKLRPFQSRTLLLRSNIEQKKNEEEEEVEANKLYNKANWKITPILTYKRISLFFIIQFFN